MHNSEYRNFDKQGFKRGSKKPHHPPLSPSPGRGDIFMEAGRLAAEYLVSQGLLPPDLLSGKWQNDGDLMNEMRDVQDSRMQDRDNLHLTQECRISALARLGNVVPDVGSGRRRSFDEFNPAGLRNHRRERRKMGKFRGYGSDFGRENRWNGLPSDEERISPDTADGEDEFTGEYHGERTVNMDVGRRVASVISHDLPLQNEIAGDLEADRKNVEFPNNSGCRASSSNRNRNTPFNTKEELNRVPDASRIFSVIEGLRNDFTADEKMGKESAPEELRQLNLSVDDDQSSKRDSDLLESCSSVKDPKQKNSSLASTVSEIDEGPVIEERNICDADHAGRSNISKKEDSFDGSSSDPPTNPNHSLQRRASESSRLPSVCLVIEAQDLDRPCLVENEVCRRSQSFSDRYSFMHEEGLIQGSHGFQRCRSMDEAKESSVQRCGTSEGTKRIRDCPSAVSLPDELIHLHDIRAKRPCLHVEEVSTDKEVTKAIDKERLVECVLSPNNRTESGLESREDTQCLPCFFKTCDLNLAVNGSEIVESPEGVVQNPSITGGSALEVEKQAPVDVGLTTSIRNFNSNDDHNGCSSDAKEVAGTDGTNGSVNENKIYCAPEQKSEPMFSNLESFLNPMENTIDPHDIQDGYGLAISEFLGANVSNGSSDPAAISDLHNQQSDVAPSPAGPAHHHCP